MRRFVLATAVAFLGVIGFTGCGGHDGGVIDVPLEENPYQITEAEQAAMNAGLKGTADIAETQAGPEAAEEARKAAKRDKRKK